MKKFYLSALMLLFFNFCFAETSLQFRADAFIPTSKLFREIYEDANPSYGVEISTSLFNCYQGWLNFDWFSKKGKTKSCHAHTKLDIFNIGVGVKYPFDFCSNFSPYVGIGPSFSNVWVKNCSLCSHKESKWAFGGIAKLGVNYYFCENFFIDLFVDYLYQRVHFRHKSADVGGFKTGLGIGYSF